MTDKKNAVGNQSEEKQSEEKQPTSNSSSSASPQQSSSKPADSKSKPKTSTLTPEQELKKKTIQGARLAKVAIVLSLVVGGGMTVYMHQALTHYQVQVAELQQQLQQSTTQMGQQLTQQNQQIDVKTSQIANRVETHLNQQQKSIESLQLALADIKGRRPNDWLLAESDYLVKLAGRKLFLEHDVLSATQLMESADQRIAALNDPSLVPLRQAMANDITSLKAVPLIDKDGLVLRLTSLEQQIDKLPLANAILPDAPKTQKPVVTEDIRNWKDNLITSMKDFVEQFVTFRTRDGDVVPLLSPKQDFYLRENLKAKLETAIRSVYDEQQAIYSTALSTARQWSISFLNQEDNRVKQFNHTLDTLSHIHIQVTYPVKLESQRLLTDTINTRLRKEVTPLLKEDNS